MLQIRVVDKHFSNHQLTPDNNKLLNQSLQHGLDFARVRPKFGVIKHKLWIGLTCLSNPLCIHHDNKLSFNSIPFKTCLHCFFFKSGLKPLSLLCKTEI